MDASMSPSRPLFSSTLPSPPASSVAPSQHPSPLPKPRRNALKPGSTKESELVHYLDIGVGKIQKRCDDRFKNRKTYTAGISAAGAANIEAYRTFAEAAKDIDGLIDVIWVSGSPRLQIPYLLNMAVMISDFLPLFGAAPKATFMLLDKMDVAFSSLLQGTDPDTGEQLPGFKDGFALSTTHKVRLKGIVERTRLVAVRVLSGENEGDEGAVVETDEDTTGGEETDGEGLVKFEGFDDDDDDDDEDDEEQWKERMIAGVYERTIAELGDVLGGSPIGIITED